MDVEEFVPHPAVETFDIGVLYRLPGINEPMLSSRQLQMKYVPDAKFGIAIWNTRQRREKAVF